MKPVLSAFISLFTALSISMPVHAQPEHRQHARIEQMITEFDKSTQEIEDILRQIEKARQVREAAVWIGIPVTIGATALGILASFASGMHPTGSDAEASRYAKRSFGTAGAVAAGTSVFFAVKAIEVHLLEEKLEEAIAKNQEAKNVFLSIQK